MLQQVLEFIHQKNWAGAAKQVAAAVADVREKLALKNLAAEVSKLMSDIEEVKALHRIGAWQAMPNRYASLRFRLHSLKGARVFRAQEASIQSVIED